MIENPILRDWMLGTNGLAVFILGYNTLMVTLKLTRGDRTMQFQVPRSEFDWPWVSSCIEKFDWFFDFAEVVP